jgi:hypothetical protein
VDKFAEAFDCTQSVLRYSGAKEEEGVGQELVARKEVHKLASSKKVPSFIRSTAALQSHLEK